MSDLLRVENISKSYTDFVLKEISFSVPKGYIMGLIGPNGSGKTTTIKAILNMIAPDSGTIAVLGKDNIAAEQEIKKNIGVVFDNNYFVDEWKISDVEKSFQLFYDSWDSGKFHTLMDTFRIAKEKRVKELSKGMQMKLMLACAFSYGAKLLILDEPTGGLDPVSRDELLEILSDFVADEQHSVLFSTHITSDLEKVADFITYLHMGRMVYTGTKEEFIEGYRMISGEKKFLTPQLEKKLIGIREFSTGYEALIRTSDLEYATHEESVYATIDEIIVYVGRQAEKDKGVQR